MELGAKATGLLTFLVGLGLMVLVFVAAFDMLHANPKTAATLQALPGQFVGTLVKILLLLLMGYVASAVAGRGIQLYEAAVRRTKAPKAAEE